MYNRNADSRRFQRLDPLRLRELSTQDIQRRITAIEPLVNGLYHPDTSAEVRAGCEAAVADIGNGTPVSYAKALKQMRQELARRDRESNGLQQVPWTPFVPAYCDPAELETPEAQDRFARLAAQDTTGRTAADYKALYAAAMDDEIYRNSRYQVAVRRHPTDDGEGGMVEMVHLSIKRVDQLPVHDWRDLQRIKNELIGPECEGIELYPAESRVTDTANQYHLWVVNSSTFRWPVGWNEGQLKMDSDASDETGAKQRRFED